jgi:pimaricinolide synthase PimS1
MSPTPGDQELLPQLKRVLLELRDTRRRLEDIEARDAEPIAIVGMGCRFPGGADSPQALWELVDEGRDAITEFPTDRGWEVDAFYDPDPTQPWTTYTRSGGFLHDAARFDAELFSIAPREALAMDPQQRVLLEATWKAFEDAGIDPTGVKGHSTGVYVGIGGTDYGYSVISAPELEGFRMTGTLTSIASGRLAYTFGLQGPAVSIDTACSSSLVAMHLACQGLRRGDCDRALVAGTTVFSTPALIVDFSRQRLLSPDGRCKAYGASADGAGFADGVGVLVMERLSYAREQGHEVLAVIRGSAINQDGASNGLIAPSGSAQARAIKDALADAGLSPSDIDAVEGHGTGTALGDPIEIQALMETYGQERSGAPLRLGSIKSNIGHTSTAAGVAGVIKMVQALRHERLPKSLHCEQPSPHVDWSGGAISLLTENVDWPRGERPRRAGVSSFGISGTNAHVILEEAPREAAPSADDAAAPAPAVALPFVVSGAGGEALAAQAAKLADFLEDNPEQELQAVATALALKRAHLSHRAGVVADGRDRLIAALRALQDGELGAGSVRGVASDPGAVAFLFSGQGSQWAGMGAGLCEELPAFRGALQDVCAELDPLLERPLLEVMFAAPDSAEAALLSDTQYTQVALFALEVALFRLVEGFGLRPDFLIGHSVGELAAAHVAGVMSLPDACALVAARGRLMGALPAGGAMLAVEASEAEVAETLGDGVAIAGVNGPRSVVVSGDEDAVGALGTLWTQRGRRTTRLDVSHAFHSHLMDPMLEAFRAVAEGVQLSEPRIPIVSNITGEVLSAEEICSADYWVRHVREPVRFADGVQWLAQAGVRRFLEIGPSTVLAALAAQTPAAEGADWVFTSCLRGARVDEREALLGFLAAAHCGGGSVDWGVLLDRATAGAVTLPTYAFQRRRYWLMPDLTGNQVAVGQLSAEHLLLGAAVRLADAEGWLLTGRLSLTAQPWLADHAIGEVVVLPATAFVELALTAAERVGAGEIEDLTLVAPLVLEAEGGVSVQVGVAAPDEDGRRTITIHGAVPAPDTEDGQAWRLHATGILAPRRDDDADGLPAGLAVWPPADAQEIDVEDFYATLADADYNYGPTFQGLRAAWRDGDAWLAEVALPEARHGDAAACRTHPALLDAALHTALLAGLDRGTLDQPAVPFSFAGVRLHAPGATALRVRVEIDEESRTLQLVAADSVGRPVLSIAGIEAQQLDVAALVSTKPKADSNLFRRGWVELASQDEATPSAVWLEEGGVAALEQAIADGSPAPQVVVAPVPDGEDPHAATAWVLDLLQTWLTATALEDARLVVLTKGALPVRDAEQSNLAHAAVPGLVRSAAMEDPLRFALIDLAPAGDFDPTHLDLALASDEPELALRDGAVFVPRLARVAADEPREPLVFDADGGAVLITGGTGGLGAVVARHLAGEHGVRRLVLTSRRGPEAEGAAELVAELAELGCEAQAVACDVTDRGQVEALLVDLPLIGVVHAAGVLDDGTIASLDAERLRAVMAPKVDGGLHLHELTADRELSFFVLFSSAAAALGAPGQGNYAAANAFLDALAHHRRAQGLAATSLAWGPWQQDSGMVADTDAARLGRIGIELLSEEEGLGLFDVGLTAPDAQLVPIRLDISILRTVARAGALPPVLSGVVPMPARRGASAKGALARLLAEAPEAEWERITLDLIRGHIAAVLGHASPEAIDPHRNFRDMGFDSLAAVELRNRMMQSTGLRLPATVVFDHPTPASAAAFVVTKVMASDRPRQAAAKVRASAPTDEPIAIVGMSCRYPGGVHTPDDLWQLVLQGRDAIGEFPVDRGWDTERLYDPDPERLGASTTRRGGFVYDAGQFDAPFFSMGPREAVATDPQQRLLLEATWEALEDAGINPESLRQSDTGVFTGVMYQDYAFGGYGAGGAGDLEGWLAIGSAGSVVSGRVAYNFGFEGPAVTVDTACSSSLVAVHLASQALRSGESSLAIAGGVTVLSNPMLFVEFSRQRGVSPDGRCKSFGAGADGVGWAEGAGIVVLERLSDARRLGHPVLAVLRGSAVNQDGASNGLAAPNGPSQERVIQRALATAGLSADDVDVVEGHGTGTALGDPIEAQALLETYGQREADGPLWLGSIKSNIGHTQAAAGVAGIIKMVQAMRHEVLPPSLHSEEASPHVDWSAGRIELLTEAVQWPAGERPRRAGISSFGISGTNAHVILEEPPARDEQPETDRPGMPVVPLLISGRGDAGRRGQAARLRERLTADPALEPVDVGHTLLTARAQLEQRAVVLGATREELLAGLDALAAGEPAANVVTGDARYGMTAFLFTGQGAQRPGMGAALYRALPVFAAALDAVCAELDERLGRSLLEVMFADEGSPEAALLHRTELTQAALFALEVALYRLLEHHGVAPDRLVGHSIGELAAVHVAGVLSLADACTLVAARGRLMGALPEGGAMLAIEASEDEVVETLPDGVSLAAVNGPRAVVVSGDADAVAALEELWSQRARKITRLTVSHAFHSHLMEPMLDELRAVAEGLTFNAPRIAIVSTVTGAEVSQELCDPDYWVKQVREPVRLADAVRKLADLGVTRFVEVGPDAVLTALAYGAVSDEQAEGIVFAPALRKDRDEHRTLLSCLAALSTTGVPVDWSVFFARTGARQVALPTYAFQRERYWLEPVLGAGDVKAAGLMGIDHPLLGAALPTAAADEWLFTAIWSLAAHPWMADHAVFDTVLLPGTAFAELALRVADEVGCEAIEELTIEAPLLLDERGAVQVQIAVGEAGPDGRREIEIFSRPEEEEDDAEWTRHASGLLTAAADRAGDALAEGLAAEAWPPADAEPIDTDDLYDRLAESGYAYGPAFQGVTAAWRRGEEIFAEVSLDGDNAREAADFGVHPALFDSAFHALLGLLSVGLEPGHVPLPFLWSGVRLVRTGATSLRVALHPTGEDTLRVTALDQTGAPALIVDTVMARTIDVARMAAAREGASGSLFVVNLTEVPLAASNSEPRVAVLGDVPGAPADALRYDDLAALIAELETGATAPELVIAEPADGASTTNDAVHAALALLQGWVMAPALGDARLALVTRGAVAVGDDEVPELAAAAVWGITRSATAEFPGQIVSVDLDRDADDAPWPGLLVTEEPQLALRSGVASAPRLVRAPAGAEASPPVAADGGTVLITGGTGGLGALMARHLARGGARHLLLASRRGPGAEGAEALVAELAELGCEATPVACDASDREALAAVLASIPDERPLTAVIHTAGVMEDGTVPSLAPDQIDRVLAPKADAAVHLHELTKDLALSDFVLFSSAAPLIGGAGQGSYAAANAVLDALAQQRRALGLPARSMAWGFWNIASGMAANVDADGMEQIGRAIRARLGLVPIAPEQGLELFEAARAIDAPVVVPAPLDTGVLRVQARTGALPSALRGLVRTVARRDRAASALAQQLAGRSQEEREAVLLEIVREELAAVLGYESGAVIEPERSILELGLDSLGAVEMRNRLARRTGVRIAPTVAFEKPTPQGLAEYLTSQIAGADGANGAGSNGSGSGNTLTKMLYDAHALGRLGEYVPLLVGASQFRPAFQAVADLDAPPQRVSFADGEGAELICVPSFLAGSGTHQFARLAAGLGGERKLSAIALPGFRPGELLPATWEAAIDVLAAAVSEQPPQGPFVLAGYSIGGALAYALAQRLEEDGLAPAGLVLIDTYAPERPEDLAAVFSEVMGSVLEERHDLIDEAVDDDSLVAMGAYARLMAGWQPKEIAAPSLLVRAGSPLGDAYERGALPWWQMPEQTVEVVGHHFELIGKSAPQTAEAIDVWIRELVGEPIPASPEASTPLED